MVIDNKIVIDENEQLYKSGNEIMKDAFSYELREIGLTDEEIEEEFKTERYQLMFDVVNQCNRMSTLAIEYQIIGLNLKRLVNNIEV